MISPFVFLDSAKYLPGSLRTLSENLKKSGLNNFKHTAKLISDAEELEMLSVKTALPYDYITCYERLEEECLPPISEWYNSLTGEHMNEETFQICHKIWKIFECRTLWDFVEVYLKFDVVLLSDIFESYRMLSMKHYGLDPVHFFSGPGLSYSAALKMLKYPIHLLYDRTQLDFILNSIKGGLSSCGELLYAKANNRYCPDYDPKVPSTFLAYLDLNNSYAKSLSERLPYKEFRWLSRKDIEKFNVLHIGRNSKTGYFCDVQLHYPPKLHNRDNGLPLVVHKKNIQFSELSALSQSQTLDNQNIGWRLVATLEDQKSYILHYRYLQFLVLRGIQVIKYNRILSFQQRKLFAGFISKNTKLRKMAKDDFSALFYKISNVQLYGKTLQSCQKHVNVKLCTSEKQAQKLIAQSNFKCGKIINENLTMFNMKKLSATAKTPIFIGSAVLDMSRTLLLHRWALLQDYYGPDNLKHIYTDTDSLAILIHTEDFYKDIKNVFFNFFDTSNYPKDSELYSEKYKMETGYLKDEAKGQIVSHIAAIRPKCWAVKIWNEGSLCKAKGIETKHLTFEHYESVLLENRKYEDTRVMFQSKNFKILKLCKSKMGLSPLLVSRYVLPARCETLAFGHYLIS